MQLSHVGRNALSLQKKENETKDKETRPLQPLLQIPKWQLQSLDQNTVWSENKRRSDGEILCDIGGVCAMTLPDECYLHSENLKIEICPKS